MWRRGEWRERRYRVCDGKAREGRKVAERRGWGHGVGGEVRKLMGREGYLRVSV